MKKDAFRHLATRCSSLVGSPVSFGLALLCIIVWAVSGPPFHFSDTWQLLINTGTTVVTFLMVFLIQATQNRDAQAIHLKLDELIRSTRDARNRLAGIEFCSEEELQHLQAEFERIRQRERRKPGGQNPVSPFTPGPSQPFDNAG